MHKCVEFCLIGAIVTVVGNPVCQASWGNPPYVRIQAMKEWAPLEVEYYKRCFRAAGKDNYDLYVVFVEKALDLLNAAGRLGFILPHKFFNAQYGAPLRQVIAEGQHLEEIVHFGDQQVFAGVTTYTCLLLLSKATQAEFRFVQAHDLAAWRTGDSVVNISTPMRGGFFRDFTQYIEQLPIRTINFADPADVARHDHVVRLVEQLLALHKVRLSTRPLHAQSVLAAQNTATDRPLDRLVYALYGLSEEEIRVVEGG